MRPLDYVPWPLLVIAVVVAAAVAAVAVVPPLLHRDPRAAGRAAARVLLAGAVLAVLAMTLVDTSGGAGGVNLVPGAGIRSSLDNINHELGWLNLVGNVLMFAPVGFLLPLACGLRWSTSTLVCAVLSITVEVVQHLLGRSADIDDVLLNTVGGALGAALGVLLLTWLRSRPRLGETVAL